MTSMSRRIRSSKDSFVDSVTKGKKGGRWLKDSVATKGIDWFLDTYAKASGLPRGSYSHEADAMVAAALAKHAPHDVRVAETLIRSFRIERGLKSFERRTPGASPAMEPPIMRAPINTAPASGALADHLRGIIRQLIREELGLAQHPQ